MSKPNECGQSINRAIANARKEGRRAGLIEAAEWHDDQYRDSRTTAKLTNDAEYIKECKLISGIHEKSRTHFHAAAEAIKP